MDHWLQDVAHQYIGWLPMASDACNLSLLLATIGICSIGVWIWMMMIRRRGLPPGPRGLPIIGHLHHLGVLPHQSLARLSNIYGPLMFIRLGAVPVLVVSTSDMAMHILNTHDKIFAGRPTYLSTVANIFPCQSVLFAQPGPYLKLMRRICTSDFFSNKRIEHFRPVRAHEMHSLVLSILSAQGSPVCVREKLHTASSNVISRMVLGQRLHEFVSTDPNTLNIVSLILEVISLLGVFNVGDYIPSLAWMDLQGYGKRSKKIAAKISSVIQEVIERRRHSSGHESGNDPPNDFLDLLLLASVDAKHTELQIEDGNIQSVLLDMFGAGTDTSTVTSEWALAELLANPEKLRKVQEELDEKVGRSRMVEESDLENLPYLRAVVNETMRLHPVAALLIPHMSSEECQIAGYRIPAKTVVYVNVWAIHRDPRVWESPLEFMPERFLGTKFADAIPGQHYSYLPFGAGRRSCPGWKLGILNVQNVLANLLQAFDWRTPGGMPPAFNEKFGLAVALEDPLIALPTPRLSKTLFDAFM